MSEILYDASRNALMENLAHFKQLQLEGVSLGEISTEVWKDINNLITQEDKQKLTEVRKQLVQLIKENKT